MSNRLFLSTRKGLFVAERSNGWTPRLIGFMGENVTLMFPDPRDGTWYAALNLGHFGVKLKASKDGGKTWDDRAVPTYPAGETLVTGEMPGEVRSWALTFYGICRCCAADDNKNNKEKN